MFTEAYNWIVLQMKTNQFFGAAAFASVAAAAFASLKGVPKWIWARFVTIVSYRVVIYQTDELYDSVTLWLRDNHKSKARNVEYSTGSLYSDSPDRNVSIDESGKKAGEILEIPIEDFFYLRKYGRWIRISFGRDKLENANNLKSVYLKHYTFKGIFASRAIRKIVGEINSKYSLSERDPRFFVSNVNYFSYMQTITGKPLSQVVLNRQIKDSIITDINKWIESKAEYDRRGIAHKRGHCYHGPPGTGKTTLARAIAIEYQMDIFTVNLNNVDGDDSLIRMCTEIRPNSILLFEDIDAYFENRSSVNKKSRVTFSGLLNALDGAVNLKSVFIIITTNHIDKLDSALLRPGRIDMIHELGFAKTPEVNEYLSMFYLKDIKLDFEVETSMCNIQNACIANTDDPDAAITEIRKYQLS